MEIEVFLEYCFNLSPTGPLLVRVTASLQGECSPEKNKNGLIVWKYLFRRDDEVRGCICCVSSYCIASIFRGYKLLRLDR